MLHLPSPCSPLPSLKTLVRILSTHTCDTESRLTSRFFFSRTSLQTGYIFTFPFIPILSHPSRLASHDTDHPQLPSQVAPKFAHPTSTVQVRPMSRSRKTAVPRSINRHTSTSWKRSASRTVGTWVTVSTRALWLRAARAGAVEARRSNSFEFELQGVRCYRCMDGAFAESRGALARARVQADSFVQLVTFSGDCVMSDPPPKKLCHVSCTSLFSCLWLSPLYISLDLGLPRCPISHPSRFATRSVFLSPPLSLVLRILLYPV